MKPPATMAGDGAERHEAAIQEFMRRRRCGREEAAHVIDTTLAAFFRRWDGEPAPDAARAPGSDKGEL